MKKEIENYQNRYKTLRDNQESWRSHWKEIVEYLLPRHGLYLTGDEDFKNRGKKKNQKIINGSAKEAVRILAAGLQGGLTSPARAWFRLAIKEKSLREVSSVQNWLHDVRDILLEVMAKSNFYGVVHSQYQELAGFGTSAMIIEEDFKTVIKCKSLTIGEYLLALDENYRPTTMFRRFKMSVIQLVEKFGEENVSNTVRGLYNTKQLDDKFDVIHVIEPNKDRDVSRIDSENKEYRSVYYEYEGHNGQYLRKSGYDTIPFIALRWEVIGSDAYGCSPGMDSLGDIKQLQLMEKDKLFQIELQTKPAMNAPPSMEKRGGKMIPGGVNYMDTSQGVQKFEPAYEVRPDIQGIAFEIGNVETRIRRAFFNDLFLAILGTDKRMTATEVAERHEEKLLMLGPVLERIQSELNITIDRIFNICDRNGSLPPPPPELQGKSLNIEYISMLAQAQKLVSISPIEQITGFIGNLAQFNPSALDKFNIDEAVDQYADALGVPPRMINSADEVKKIREMRMQEQAKMQEQEQMSEMIDKAKTLSDTKMNDDTALDAVVGAAGG